jgi:hypothetical protein
MIGSGMVGAFLIGWNGSFTEGRSASDNPTDFSVVVAGVAALQPIAFVPAGLLSLLASSTPNPRIRGGMCA